MSSGAVAVSRSYDHLNPPLKTEKLKNFELWIIDSSLESTEKQKYVIENLLASLLFELFDFGVGISTSTKYLRLL
jgi:hypothetical protein